MNEAEAITIICAILGGEAEVSHDYTINQGHYSIRVDCETETHVIEVGLDKRSSLDSIQQAEFASWLSGKLPLIVIVDRDGVEDDIQYRIKTAARRSGVELLTFSDDYLLRWKMTSFLRERQGLLQ